MATFTIWEGDGCGIALGRGTERPAIDPAAVLVATFEADSWPAACQVLNDRYGWGEYRDDGMWEPIEEGRPMATTATDDGPDLLPCPFCGGEAKCSLYAELSPPDDHLYAVTCPICLARQMAEGKAAARAAWNRRADATPAADSLEGRVLALERWVERHDDYEREANDR